MHVNARVFPEDKKTARNSEVVIEELTAKMSEECSKRKGTIRQKLLRIPSEWRLFIDSSSLKTVLLPNSNKKPFIPTGHSGNMKECSKNMQVLLDAIHYSE